MGTATSKNPAEDGSINLLNLRRTNFHLVLGMDFDRVAESTVYRAGWEIAEGISRFTGGTQLDFGAGTWCPDAAKTKSSYAPSVR